MWLPRLIPGGIPEHPRMLRAAVPRQAPPEFPRHYFDGAGRLRMEEGSLSEPGLRGAA